MIFLSTQGGIGNQLFQIAFALKLSEENNKEIYLLNDHLNPSGGDKRSRELEFLGFNFKKKNLFLPKYKWFRSKYIKYFKPTITYIDDSNYRNGFINHQRLLLDGFFQDPKELKTVRNYLTKIIQNKLRYHNFNFKDKNSVAVHIRRGDYVSNKHASNSLGFIGKDYYLSSIELIKQKINNPNIEIFTDDIKWVKNNLNQIGPYNIISERKMGSNKEFLYFFSYQNFIIANSSFSWWAPWLNCSSEKGIVVCPKKWYSNGKDSKLNKVKDWIYN
jgi:hypothetical protein